MLFSLNIIFLIILFDAWKKGQISLHKLKILFSVWEKKKKAKKIWSLKTVDQCQLCTPTSSSFLACWTKHFFHGETVCYTLPRFPSWKSPNTSFSLTFLHSAMSWSILRNIASFFHYNLLSVCSMRHQNF